LEKAVIKNCPKKSQDNYWVKLRTISLKRNLGPEPQQTYLFLKKRLFGYETPTKEDVEEMGDWVHV